MGIFDRWLRTEEKAALDAAVRAIGRPATALVLEAAMPADHVFPATATHFGGNPYFEKGDTWPTLEGNGRPYDFVCQVNLTDCPDKPAVRFDLFTVFLCWSLYPETDFDRFCLVRTYRDADQSKAVTVPRPAPLGPTDYQVKPCSLAMERGLITYPWNMRGHPEVEAAAAKFRDPEGAYADSLKRLGFHHDFRSRVGGFATWVHGNTLESDDMVLLAQIDYEPKANNCIGDAAPIFIGVAPGDPPRIQSDAFQSF